VNFLLNVGPTPLGTIPPESEERLQAIGAWMRKNGESIYGTSFGPLQGLDAVRTTVKNGMVYLHVFDWPADEIAVEGLPGHVTSVMLLSSNRRVRYRREGSRLVIARPDGASGMGVTVLAVRT